MVNCNDCGKPMRKTEEYENVTIWECDTCNTMQETFPNRKAAIKRSGVK